MSIVNLALGKWKYASETCSGTLREQYQTLDLLMTISAWNYNFTQYSVYVVVNAVRVRSVISIE